MSSAKSISRWTLSRRLQELALRIAAGKPVKVGGETVIVPDRVLLEEELEASGDDVELELEISWSQAAQANGRAPRRPPRRRAAK